MPFTVTVEAEGIYFVRTQEPGMTAVQERVIWLEADDTVPDALAVWLLQATEIYTE